MKAPDAVTAKSLGMFTKMLIESNVIEDNEALTTALSAVAKKCMDIGTPQKDTKKNQRIFDVTRMADKYAKTKEKLEKIRQKMQDEELLKYTNRPKINKKSFELSNHENLPLHLRAQKVIEYKQRWLADKVKEKNEQEQEIFNKKCTFSPNKKNNSTRDPQKVIEDLYNWKKKVDDNLKKSQEYYEKEKLGQYKTKPKITEKSKVLSMKVKGI
ncbi:hypothetical protein SteCoe_4123 [Stentor coeruleus]|uniref:Uncharacterized protein n=1 Tax=Stentor coeruleus TaxID=5963 RepID=A0A1R2CVK5_9CILI|nr:hypothetical protein SteCoe_4123 [Stentor coeruleus]